MGVHQRLVFPQGSAITIPILIELFRQGERRRGLLEERRPVSLSDNTATNLLIDALGMDAVNRTLADMGFRETRLQRRMIRLVSEVAYGY